MTASTSRSGESTAAVDASYGWDNEGRMTSLTGPGGTDTYAFDVMGRLSSGGATYGPAGELLTFNNVTRTYNNLGQLTRMTRTGVMDMEYRYTAGSNNGRISQSKDYVTGEEVTYSYDSLNRLSHAETTDSAWGTTYVYDGWGNLLQKTQTKGAPPSLSMIYDPSLNMPAGSTPPSALTGVDEDDRPISGYGELGGYGDYTYDQSGKKVAVTWLNQQDGQLHMELYFHSITGQRLARYQGSTSEGDDNGVHWYAFGLSFHDAAKHIGGQLTTWNNTGATTDRLGSIRAMDNGERYTYYPYGESHTTTGGNAQYAGLESPVRSYDPNTARFNRPDPLGMKAVVMGDPGSWNRFAYVGGDPVNFIDPKGLADFSVTGYCWACTDDDPPAGGSRDVGPGGSGPDYFLPVQNPDPPKGGAPGGPSYVYTMAVFSALEALKDPDCKGIFNTTPGATVYDPRDVLASMAFGGYGGTVPQGSFFGSVTFGTIPMPDAAVTQADPATRVTLDPPTAYTGVRAASAVIILQGSHLSDGYYGAQSISNLASTLIHELGHVYNIVAGLGGSRILWDSSSTGPYNQDAEDKNRKTLESCHPR